MLKNFFKPKFILAIIVCALLIFGIVYIATDKERVSDRFAQQLFDYPIPMQTKLIEEKQYNGHPWVTFSGNSGAWVVIVYQRFSTTLSKEEILTYYEKAGKFKFPKSETKGVVLELYFEGDMKKVIEDKGVYYESETRGPLYSYFDDQGNINLEELGNNTNQEYEYVIQLVSSFDFFLNID
ncbi:hypothetical protein [Bacillus suaedae]|uniref:Uncharacterized protein n=1 Tax=Halalkalibacter suaedae TaxID=2822140 RepID=A0A940WSQ6_9BACI|nr:hypothetical protein [Bacillus suaedae]MBP3951800.1 hypothetical protein [Bacillus suaedae]